MEKQKNKNAPKSDQGKKSILLVDDEEIVREMVRQILLLDDYEVEVARNGSEALEICESRETAFDLLVTDIDMPQMNGSELSKKIMAMNAAENVLYISGFVNDSEIFRSISKSGEHFLAKPFLPEALTSKISEILNNK